MKNFFSKCFIKTMSCLIIVFLIFPCIVPISAFAEDDSVCSFWGDFFWRLNRTTGELSVSGEGAMPSLGTLISKYPLDVLVPWHYLCEEIKTVIIDDGITKVTSHMFAECSNLTDIYIGSDVQEISVSAFEFCNKIENYYVDDDNQYITAENGILYSKDKTAILRYPISRKGGFSIPDTVKTIENRAFFQCKSLTEINIPTSVTDISAYAFFDCDGLTSLIIPDSVTKINASSFAYCENVSNLYISKNLKVINAGAFCGLTSLKHVVLPRELTKIESKGFGDCTSLESVVMYNKVTSIQIPFDGSDNITDIYFIATEEDKNHFNIKPEYLFTEYNLHYGISGTLPNGIKWELESNEKTMTLTGSGTLTGSEDIWAEYGEYFNCVYVSDGISGIEKCIGNKYAESGTAVINGTKYKTFAGKYTVSYDVNGGVGSVQSQTKIHDKSIQLSDIKPTKNGFLFLGWSTDKHAYTPEYYSGSEFTKNRDVMLYAVWGTKELETITIISDPTKLIYSLNEPFDMTGIAVELKYNDGTTEVLTDGFTVSGFDPKTAGRQVVTLVKNDIYVYFYATVLSDDITVSEIKPVITKNEYFVGEEIDYKTIILEVTLSDGSLQTIHNGFTVEGFDSTEAGNICITFSYGGLSATADIAIKADENVSSPEAETSKYENEFSETEEVSENNNISENSVTADSEKSDYITDSENKSYVIYIAAAFAVLIAAVIIGIVMKNKKK